LPLAHALRSRRRLAGPLQGLNVCYPRRLQGVWLLKHCRKHTAQVCSQPGRSPALWVAFFISTSRVVATRRPSHACCSSGCTVQLALHLHVVQCKALHGQYDRLPGLNRFVACLLQMVMYSVQDVCMHAGGGRHVHFKLCGMILQCLYCCGYCEPLRKSGLGA
jgi:hypothetical protein